MPDPIARAVYRRAVHAFRSDSGDECMSLLHQLLANTSLMQREVSFFCECLLLLGSSEAKFGRNVPTALHRFQESVTMLKEHFGERDERVAEVLLAMSTCLLHQHSGATVRDVSDALRHLEDAKRIVENCSSSSRVARSILAADIYHNMGVCFELVAEYADALHNYTKSISIRRLLKDGHGVVGLRLADTMEHVAMLLRGTSSTRTQHILQRVLHTRRGCLPKHHPLIYRTLLLIAMVEHEVGNRVGMHKRIAAVLSALHDHPSRTVHVDPALLAAARLLHDTLP